MRITFVENDCTFTHDGHTFESGGAYLLQRKDNGKHEAMLYVRELTDTPAYTDRRYWGAELVTWHGKHVAWCKLGRPYTSNMGDRRRSVWADVEGIPMHGVWYSTEWRECVLMRETKH